MVMKSRFQYRSWNVGILVKVSVSVKRYQNHGNSYQVKKINWVWHTVSELNYHHGSTQEDMAGEKELRAQHLDLQSTKDDCHARPWLCI